MKIDLRTRRLGIIAEAQEADPATRIRYAAKYANIANAWKKLPVSYTHLDVYKRQAVTSAIVPTAYCTSIPFARR